MIRLSDDEYEALKQLARRPRTVQSLVQRARLILACAEGQTNTTVAARMRVTIQMVGKWRTRILQKWLGGLLDEPRPGTPRRLSDAEVERVVTMTSEAMPKNATHWSTCPLAVPEIGCCLVTSLGLWSNSSEWMIHFQDNRFAISLETNRERINSFLISGI